MTAGRICGAPGLEIAIAKTALKKKLMIVSDDDRQADRDQHRAGQVAERLAVEQVALEVVHREPDPHRGDDLDQRQSPVGEDQPQAVEQQCEGADGERERGEHAPGPAQPQNRLLDLRLVVVLDRADERLDAMHERLGVMLGSGLRRPLPRLIGSRPLIARHARRVGARLILGRAQAAARVLRPAEPSRQGVLDGVGRLRMIAGVVTCRR